MAPQAPAGEEFEGPEQRQKLLDAVLAMPDKWDDEQLQYLKKDVNLGRYLRARKGHVQPAAKLLAGTLHWRKSMKLDTLCISEFNHEMTTGKMYVMGPDADGHAILVTRKRSDAFKAGEHDHYMRHLAFTLETCVRVMDGAGARQSQWVWLLDMNGYSRANSPPLSVSLATLRVLADHYPERLKHCFFIDAPSIFSWLWGALSRFLDPVTQRKVHFINSADLPKDVGQAVAPTDAGGAAHPAPAAHAQDAKAVQAFLPYLQYYRQPYDEKPYRALLEQSGWPETVQAPSTAATN